MAATAVIVKRKLYSDTEVDVYLCDEAQVEKKIHELYINEIMAGKTYDEQNTYINQKEHYARIYYDDDEIVTITTERVHEK
jgi:hypothetical protein